MNLNIQYEILDIFYTYIKEMVPDYDDREKFILFLIDKMERLGVGFKISENQTHINLEITPNIIFLNNIPNLILEFVFALNLDKISFCRQIVNMNSARRIHMTYEEFIGNAYEYLSQDICQLLFNKFVFVGEDTCISIDDNLYLKQYIYDFNVQEYIKFSFLDLDLNLLHRYGAKISNDQLFYPLPTFNIYSEIYRLHLVNPQEYSTYYTINREYTSNCRLALFDLKLVCTQPFMPQNQYRIAVSNIDIINPLKSKSILSHHVINQHLHLQLFNAAEKITTDNVNSRWEINNDILHLKWLFAVLKSYRNSTMKLITDEYGTYHRISLNEDERHIDMKFIYFQGNYYIYSMVSYDIMSEACEKMDSTPINQLNNVNRIVFYEKTVLSFLKKFMYYNSLHLITNYTYYINSDQLFCMDFNFHESF